MTLLIPKGKNSNSFVECGSVRALINLDKQQILTINLYSYSSIDFFEKTSQMLPIFLFDLLEADAGIWAGDRIKIESVPATTSEKVVREHLESMGYGDFEYEDLFKYLKFFDLTEPKDLSPEYTEDRMAQLYANWVLYDHDADVYLDTSHYSNGLYVDYDLMQEHINPIVFVLANLTGYESWYAEPSLKGKDVLKTFFNEAAGFSAFAGSRVTIIPANEIPKTAIPMKL